MIAQSHIPCFSCEDVPPPPGRSGWPWTVESPVSTVPLSTQNGHYPRISIVTPSFNQADYLEETIRSVLLQNYPNLEYLVVDGGSTDGSLDILRRYEPWLSWCVSEPDAGQVDAINKGAGRATGEWFAWLNSDDLYLPGAFEEVARIAMADPDVDWVVGHLQMIDAQGGETGYFNRKMSVGNWLDFVCTKWPQGTALPQPASFWKRELFAAVGALNDTLHFAMDHEFWGRLAYHGCRPRATERVLASFRDHGASKTSRGWLPFYREELAIVDAWRKRVSAPDAEQLRRYARTLQKLILQQQLKAIRRKLTGSVHG